MGKYVNGKYANLMGFAALIIMTLAALLLMYLTFF
jgi:hypothetical protein